MPRSRAALAAVLALGCLALSRGEEPHPVPAVDQPGTPGTARPSRLLRADLLSAEGQEYATALVELTGGRADAARDRTMELDRGHGAARTPAAARKVERVAFELLEVLGEAEPESLVPVLELRVKVGEAFQDSGEVLLATASMRVAARGASLYASVSRSDQALPLSAAILSSLGFGAQSRYALGDASELYGAALRIDPASEAALIGLGSINEMLGRYEFAVPFFSRLRDRPGQDAEATLRLGVNLGHLGRNEAALAALEQACSASEPWIAIIAHQERARLLLKLDRVGEAVTLLQAAHGRFPDDAGLLAELVLALDRTGNPRRALELAARLTAAPDRRSPRLRYARWPVAAAGAARAEFARAASDRLEVLARTIVPTAAGG